MNLIEKGCLDFLTFLSNICVDSTSVKLVLMALAFQEVFPTNLPNIPPDRDIEFCIDLEMNTLPISIFPSLTSLAELGELKT